MSEIHFTIIIPHHNTPKLLERCLESIPKREDVQVIVVDDNSDVKCVDFCDFPGLNEKSVEIYFLKKWGGAGYARNVGLKHAKGEWILFADSDDYFSENLEILLSSNIPDDVDIIKYGFKKFLINGALASQLSTKNSSQVISFRENKNPEDLYMSYNCVPWNKMVRRHFLEKRNIRFQEVKYSNDVLFAVELALNNPKVLYTDMPIYIQEERQNSLVTSKVLDNFIIRMNVALNVDKKLKKANFQILSCHYWLFNILQFSYPKFLYYSFKEMLVLGYDNMYTDYYKACVLGSIETNPFRYLINCLRVKLSLRKRIKSIIN